jgi:endonuclease/exonuclease/phosphatase family metal-dependent hydrolase
MVKPLRIFSYNIHKGFDSGKRSFILRHIREALRVVHPDVVLLQEVHGHHSGLSDHMDDWPTTAQFEYLADALWPHTAYGRNAVYVEGHHGNAILSKYPIVYSENIDVSTNRLEQRGLLHGILDVPGCDKPLHTFCVHLGLLESERRKQVKFLCDRVKKHVPIDEPLLIGGDFNDWRGKINIPLRRQIAVSEAFESIQGRSARTFPSWMPALRLDRIYFRGLQPVKVHRLASAPWSRLSDHAALYAELSL